MDQHRDDVIIVDFDDRAEADLAVERLRQAGVSDTQIVVGDRGDPRVERVATTRPADQDTPHQTGVAVKGGAMAWGSLWWMVVGGVAGVVLGVLLALVPVGGLDFWERAGLYAVIGLLGGSGAGFVFGGGQEPWAREGGRPGQRGLSVAVRLQEPGEGRRVEDLLVGHGATTARRRSA
jgi:hypothetical protein